MNPKSINNASACAWAIEFNQRHRFAPIEASMRRLRFTAVLICATLLFLAGRAFAETNADAPPGKPDASIDLATKDGVDLVKGQWRYSDTKINDVYFKPRSMITPKFGLMASCLARSGRAAAPSLKDGTQRTG